jgi:glycine/D-amino acid oxidase-like deaminating enzyme
LQKSGKKCILIEAANIGFGTTGGTTAHINNFLDTTYSEAISKFGLEDAVLLYQSTVDAIGVIEKISAIIKLIVISKRKRRNYLLWMTSSQNSWTIFWKVPKKSVVK